MRILVVVEVFHCATFLAGFEVEVVEALVDVVFFGAEGCEGVGAGEVDDQDPEVIVNSFAKATLFCFYAMIEEQ